MLTRRRGLLGFVAGVLAAVLFPGKWAQASRGVGSQAGQRLEGSWLVTVTIPGQPPGTRLFTYTPDGSLLTTAIAHPVQGPGHGAWVRAGDREFAVTWIALRFDPERNFIGTLKTWLQIQLNETMDEYSSSFRQETYDREGNVVGRSGGTADGKRIGVEILP